MAKEAIQALYHHYKMELLGGDRPRIKITLHKNDEPREYFLRELPQGSPVTALKVSTDSLSEGDGGKFTVMVSIQGKPTPEVLVRAGRTKEDDIFTICNISSLHHSNTADRFFGACAAVAAAGGKIPITILNAKSRVLCVLEADKPERFSWKEMAEQIKTMKTTAGNSSQTSN